MNWLADKMLDVLWDATLPLSGTCPVCAFWRGVAAGFFAFCGALAVWWLL